MAIFLEIVIEPRLSFNYVKDFKWSEDFLSWISSLVVPTENAKFTLQKQKKNAFEPIRAIFQDDYGLIQ